MCCAIAYPCSDPSVSVRNISISSVPSSTSLLAGLSAMGIRGLTGRRASYDDCLPIRHFGGVVNRPLFFGCPDLADSRVLYIEGSAMLDSSPAFSAQRGPMIRVRQFTKPLLELLIGERAAAIVT